jgi:hypothetical protein
MIVYKTKSLTFPVIPLKDPMEDAQEALAILVVFKDRLSFIAPGGNGIDGIRIFKAERLSYDEPLIFPPKKC